MNTIDTAPEPEFFAVACPRCAAAIAVSDDLVGTVAGCPLCQTPFRVPEPELQPPPPPPPPPPAAAGPDAPLPADHGWHEMAPALDEAAAQPMERHRDLEFREPVTTLDTSHGPVELRRLNDDEKRRRRSRRNIVMLLAGTTILIVLTLLLGREPKKKPR